MSVRPSFESLHFRSDVCSIAVYTIKLDKTARIIIDFIMFLFQSPSHSFKCLLLTEPSYH